MKEFKISDKLQDVYTQLYDKNLTNQFFFDIVHKKFNIVISDFRIMGTGLEFALKIAQLAIQASKENKPIFRLKPPYTVGVYWFILGEEDEIVNYFESFLNLQAFV